MHILLLILKILLIIVLSVIGLAVLLVLLVLIAPVRYRIYVKKYDDIFAKFTARWLGFVLCFKAVYDTEGLDYRLRLFGGTVWGSGKSKKESDEPDEDGASDGAQAEDGDDMGSVAGIEKKEACAEPSDSVSEELESVGKSDYAAEKTESAGETDPALTEYPSIDSEDKDFVLSDSEFEEHQSGIFRRIGRKIDSVCGIIADKAKLISDKLKSLKKKKDGYTKLVNNVRTKEAIRVAKAQLIAVLKHLKPTKVKGQLVYGTGDPATTGQHLGYMSVLFPLYCDHIDVTPDFMEKRLEGDLFMKGRVRLITIGWYVLKVIWNKNVKITISRFKKISGGN